MGWLALSLAGKKSAGTIGFSLSSEGVSSLYSIAQLLLNSLFIPALYTHHRIISKMIVFSYNKGSFTLFSMWMTLFKDFIYLYLDREEGRERGWAVPACVASRSPATGDLARNSGMCPDWEWNQWSFGSQTGAQSTDPHQPGLNVDHFYWLICFLVIGLCFPASLHAW